MRRSDAKFELEYGASANGWTVPTYSGETRNINGATYYGYTSTYTGVVPYPDRSGVIYVRGANWQANYSSGWTSRSGSYVVTVVATLNSRQTLEYSSPIVTFP